MTPLIIACVHQTKTLALERMFCSWDRKGVVFSSAPHANVGTVCSPSVHRGHQHLKRPACSFKTQYTFSASALCDAIKIILNREEHRGSHS